MTEGSKDLNEKINGTVFVFTVMLGPLTLFRWYFLGCSELNFIEVSYIAM